MRTPKEFNDNIKKKFSQKKCWRHAYLVLIKEQRIWSYVKI